MLPSCDVKNCENKSATIVEKKKSRRKDERIAWLERQMILATRVIHIY